ncbi:MAG: hypothetical protein A2231_11320 [Candidatus Firestonebacteria bacterium RIFOXYA2_FULL_40_8]|nr:MAG: hypothetical protein A2231_11320 [Candidatus Firestonebacteria bacterium RIFOXYA2_FULL_40_8]
MNEGKLPLYYGFGGIINTYNSLNPSSTADFGVRGTFGLSYIFKENNFDIFFEMSPTLRFSPASGLYLSGSLGVRYYFL